MKIARQTHFWLAAMACGVMAACGSDSGDAAPPPTTPLLACDESMKTAFAPDAMTQVVTVKAFKVGDPLVLSGQATPMTTNAKQALCGVELLIGPGNAGPADAPSTAKGIGIQIWLPAKEKWNKRLHALGGGGWQGGYSTGSSDVFPAFTPWEIAQDEGAVSATTDTGHVDPTMSGSFAMNPDGTINTTLWQDFSERSLHEMAVKAKQLAQAYYGSAPKYAYFDGGSTGGRQGLKAAQAHPADYDGIAAAYPAINWSKFITAELYPQIVFQRDLGGTPLSKAQSDLVSRAAIQACDLVGGKHLGFLIDPSQCRYDPTMDASVLCQADGGSNTTSACVTPAQARAANKIWYGMTADGSVPSPAQDNGWAAAPTGAQRWYGLTRGTSFYGQWFVDVAGLPPSFTLALASPVSAFTIATDQVALELQNSRLAGANFRNAGGNGIDGWKSLSYAQLNNAFDIGVALQPQFGRINTDNPDLSAFKSRGGKMITVHGLNDELIFPQGSIHYYDRVAAQLGGLAAVQSFYKLYLIPGMGHGSFNGTANPDANPPVPGHGQVYALLTDWVEKGIAPDRVDLSSPIPVPVAKSLPMCAYPKKATYISGDPFVAASYVCG
ncbi:MAG TPA: tannase/feruloyl esterase family alpha/beta hydrolase [Aquabacterium sp.]|nr:tannase/feruloyl esterase family alpha/beta hydrolase [Aquabacterium sp.]